MLDLIQEKNIDATLKYFGTSKSSYNTQKMMYGVIGLLMGIIVAFATGNPFMYGVALILALGGYKLPYILINSTRKSQAVINKYLFADFLQTFLALIGTTNNVYATLVASKSYVEEPLRTELEKLIDLIEFDNRREYYTDFARYIDTSEAYMVMDMIYKFSAFGLDNESLIKISELIDNLQNNQIDELIEKKMNSQENVGFIPLFITMILVGGYTVVMFIHYFSQGSMP